MEVKETSPRLRVKPTLDRAQSWSSQTGLSLGLGHGPCIIYGLFGSHSLTLGFPTHFSFRPRSSSLLETLDTPYSHPMTIHQSPFGPPGTHPRGPDPRDWKRQWIQQMTT